MRVGVEPGPAARMGATAGPGDRGPGDVPGTLCRRWYVAGPEIAAE